MQSQRTTTFTNAHAFETAQKDETLSLMQMNGEWWFQEKIHGTWGQMIRIDDFLLYEKTAFQTVAVFHNEKFGNVMLLDGIVQITENNWRPYQEMFVAGTTLPLHHPSEPIINMLIIGGGDGGVATIALDLFPNVHVTMVEIDKGVIDTAKEYLPHIAQSLKTNNPRFKLIIGDGIEFVKKPENHGIYHAAVIDCTDPTNQGPAKGLFGTDFHTALKRCLTPNGIILQQSGVLEFQLDEVKETFRMMADIYRHPLILHVPMTTYPGGMTLVGGSDAFNPNQSIDWARQFELASVPIQRCEYINPLILTNAYNNLPNIHQQWVNEITAKPQHSPRLFGVRQG